MNISPEFVVMRLIIKIFAVCFGFSFGMVMFSMISFVSSSFMVSIAEKISGTIIQIWIMLFCLAIAVFWEAIEALMVAFVTRTRPNKALHRNA
jgi:hypothetical protein